MQVPKKIAEHAEIVECPSREAWLAERTKSLGASDSGALLGITSHASRPSLWADKTSPPMFSASTEAQEIKLAMEAPVLELYHKRYGGDLLRWPQTWLARSKAHPYLHATPDGLVLDHERKGWGCLQIKCWSEFDRASWAEEPPLYVVVQCQQEMAVTGAEWAAVAVMFGTQALQRFIIERNERFIELLIREAQEFWAYVQSRIEPPMDASPATKRALERLHPNDNGLSVLLPEDAGAMLTRRARLKSLAKKISDAVDGIDNQLRAWIGDCTYGITPDGQCASWKTQERKEYTVAATSFRTLRTVKPPKSPCWADEQIDYKREERKRIPAHIKQRLFAQSDRCCWCNKQMRYKDATIEHVAPLAKGGSNDESNLALACPGCNSKRGDDATQPAEFVA